MWYKTGDVVILKWKTLSSDEGQDVIEKKHPFIISKIQDKDVYVLVTSSVEDKVSKKFPYNIPIQYPKEAGLTKLNTHVKVDKEAKITFKDIYKKVGHLVDEDLRNILRAYYKCDRKITLEQLELFNILLNN